MPSFTGSEWTNRQQWAQMPKTADMRVLDQTAKRSKAAHDALMQAQAMEAEQDNAILNTATPDEFANLFGTPRTEREARLQRIVQKDVNAKNFGVRLMGTPDERLKYQSQQLGVQGSYLQNAAARLNLQQDPIAFAMQQRQAQADYLHGNNADLRASNSDMRAQQANTRAGEEFDFQKQYWLPNQQMKQSGHDADIARSTFAQMMQAESMLQNNADRDARFAQSKAVAEQRQGNAEAESQRKYFENLADAAYSGALTADQLGQFGTRFDPVSMSILHGYVKAGAEKRAGGWGSAPAGPGAAKPPGYLQMLRQSPSIPLPTGPLQNPFFSPTQTSTASAAPPAMDVQWPVNYGDEEEDSFDMGIGSQFAQPPMAPPAMVARPTARPMAPAPQQQQRRPFIPGSQVRGPSRPDGTQGQLYLVLPNGRFRPIAG